jgi:hypothetical protein
MERLDVAAAADLGIGDLAERMIGEAAAAGSVIMSRFEVGAWCNRSS